MFPCYGFARFDAGRFLHRVCYTRGVRGVVSFGGVLAQLDDSIIELMRSRSEENGLVQLGTELKTGDRVKVTCGQLANFMGVFEHGISGTDRVAILLTAVRYQARVVIDRKFVAKV
jgi:transcription antitermination factor NusG